MLHVVSYERFNAGAEGGSLCHYVYLLALKNGNVQDALHCRIPMQCYSTITITPRSADWLKQQLAERLIQKEADNVNQDTQNLRTGPDGFLQSRHLTDVGK